MTASRRRANPATREEVTQALGSIRQQQRDARAYAEVWYQALRAWEVIVPPIVIPACGTARSTWTTPLRWARVARTDPLA